MTLPPAASPPTTSVTAGLPPLQRDYLQTALNNGDSADGSASDLLTFGQTVCSQSASGLIGTGANDNAALALMNSESAASPSGAGSAPHADDLMNLAAKFLCPQYASLIHKEVLDDDSNAVTAFCADVQNIADDLNPSSVLPVAGYLSSDERQAQADASTAGSPFQSDIQTFVSSGGHDLSKLSQDCSSNGDPIAGA